MRYWVLGAALLAAAGAGWSSAGEKAGSKDNMPPPGFTALFNGKDLTGWQGLIPINQREKMSSEQRAEAQKKADAKMREHWKVVDGVLVFDGKGQSLQSAKDYGNFELYVDWKILPKGDSGIYLRGQPQVQIWEASDKAAQKNGEFVGSGGLYNNQKNPRDPIAVADNPAGQWNTFHIKMVGDKVTVKLNGKVVVDDTPLENYFQRGQPLPSTGPIELQNHGNTLWFKNIYVKDLP